jgi:hypothetical protein
MDLASRKDVHMTTPQIATILDDGTYGLRDMTQDEITHKETLVFPIMPKLPTIEEATPE